MDVTPLIPADRQVIDGYGPGQFCVRGVWRAGAQLVFPGEALDWAVDGFASLTLESFAPVLEAEPKVGILLLGCGAKNQLVPRAIREPLRQRGVIVEGMDSGAACRTYNILLAEGRPVAAALIPV